MSLKKRLAWENRVVLKRCWHARTVSFLKRHTLRPYPITLPIESEHSAESVRLKLPDKSNSSCAEQSLVPADRCADRMGVGPAAKKNPETKRGTGSHVFCFPNSCSASWCYCSMGGSVSQNAEGTQAGGLPETVRNVMAFPVGSTFASPRRLGQP